MTHFNPSRRLPQDIQWICQYSSYPALLQLPVTKAATYEKSTLKLKRQVNRKMHSNYEHSIATQYSGALANCNNTFILGNDKNNTAFKHILMQAHTYTQNGGILLSFLEKSFQVKL